MNRKDWAQQKSFARFLAVATSFSWHIVSKKHIYIPSQPDTAIFTCITGHKISKQNQNIPCAFSIARNTHNTFNHKVCTTSTALGWVYLYMPIFLNLPYHSTIVMVVIAWLSVCVCVHGSAHSGQLAVISQWDITFVPVMYQAGIHSLFFSNTYSLSLSHTHTEDFTQRKCPDRPSQHDTPEQWCFPLVPTAWGIFHWLIVFTLLAVLLSSQSISLLCFISLFVSVKLDLSFPPAVFVSSIFWRMTLTGEPLITMKAMEKKCKYTVLNTMAQCQV